MELLLASIIGGISAACTAWLAYRGYDQTLRNKQRYHAWQIIFEKKLSTFDAINESIYEMALGLTYIRSISTIEDNEPTIDDWRNVVGWNNLIAEYFDFDSQFIIPPDIIQNSINWLSGSSKINAAEFKEAKDVLCGFITSQISKRFFNVNVHKGNITLIVNNPNILEQISEIIIWLNDFNQSNRVTSLNDIEYNQFVEDFRKKMSDNIKLMRYELHLNIEKIIPDLIIKKIDVEEAKKIIAPQTASDSQSIQP